MSKRRKPFGLGPCAYCTEEVREREAEHVFPEAWHPDGTPPSTMIRVPSCSPCNREYGRLEERLRLPLIGGLPVNHPATRGVLARAMRALDPNAATTVREVAHRDAQRRRFLGQFDVLGPRDAPAWHRAVQRPATLLPTPGGLLIHGVPSVRIDPNDLDAIGVKLIRGCYFHATGSSLPKTSLCEVVFPTFDPVAMTRQLIDAMQIVPFGCPPAFIVGGKVHAADTRNSVWVFELWQHYVVLGFTGYWAQLMKDPTAGAATDGPERRTD